VAALSTWIGRLLAGRLAAIINCAGVGSTPALFVRASGDEASGVIGFASFSSWVFSALYGALPHALTRQFTAARWWERVLLGVGLAYVAFVMLILGNYINYYGHLRLAVVTDLLLPNLAEAWPLQLFVAVLTWLWLALVVGSLVVPIVLMVGAITWGPGQCLLAPFLEVSAEAVPSGHHIIDQLGSRQTGMNHRIYDDHKAIERVREWLTSASAVR
jgi:hypothetical protein